MPFVDRTDAGRRLAARLTPRLAGRDVLVLGLPRGGVPVAYQVALALAAPLDVLVVRKLGVPGQPELAMGAIGEQGVRVLEPHVVEQLRISDAHVALIERAAREELDELVRRLRGDRPPVPLAGRQVLLVDDGIATGSTARAACRVARLRGAAAVLLAVPVAARESLPALDAEADEVFSLRTPRRLYSVGQWYRDFRPVAQADVLTLLTAAAARLNGQGAQQPAHRPGPSSD